MSSPIKPSSAISEIAHQSRANESSTEIAKRAVVLLEKKLQEEFGYQVNLGFELEFALSPSLEYIRAAKEAGLNISNPFYLPDKEIKKTGTAVSAKKPELLKSALFPDSPYICYAYKETGSYNGKFLTAEIVFSHEASDVSRSSGKLFSVCRAVEATKSFLIKTAAQNQKRGFDQPTSTELESISKGNALEQSKIIHKHIADVSFAPYVTHFDDWCVHGLHLNFSLVPTAKTSQSLEITEEGVISKKLREANAEMQFLLVGSDNGYMRLTHQFSSPSGFVNVKNDPERWHVSTAGADSDPYIAAMINLTGIYAGLCEIQRGRSFSSNPKYYSAATEPEDAKENFDHAKMVFEVLDTVEPGLGKKFKESVLNPGQTKQTDSPKRS